jgi:serine phosphatase RsbU (regulator of sigma subunit)
VNSADVADITLMNPGDILFLYSDGVDDGSNEEDRLRLERIVPDHKERTAKEICNAILDYALRQDQYFQQILEKDRIADKTALIIKHS